MRRCASLRQLVCCRLTVFRCCAPADGRFALGNVFWGLSRRVLLPAWVHIPETKPVRNREHSQQSFLPSACRRVPNFLVLCAFVSVCG